MEFKRAAIHTLSGKDAAYLAEVGNSDPHPLNLSLPTYNPELAPTAHMNGGHSYKGMAKHKSPPLALYS